MWRPVIACALVVFSCAVPSVAQSRYSMNDLHALVDQRAWKELVAHLGDIAPSDRDQAWYDVAEQAGIGSIEDAVKKESPVDGLVISEELLDTYPGIARSKTFMQKRNEVGMAGFEICYHYDKLVDTCSRLLRTFVAEDPDNGDLAWRAAKLIRLNMANWVAIPYFRAGLSDPSPARSCSDGDLKNSLLSALTLPKEDRDYVQPLKAANEIASGRCFPALRPALVKEAVEANDSYFRENVCPLLRSRGALQTNAQRQACAKA